MIGTFLLAGSSLCYGDTIFGIHAGVGQWNTDVSGQIGERSNPITAKELGFKDNSNNFIYAAVEHPIPLLPNIRVSQYNLEQSGEAVVTRSFTLDDVTFEANANTVSELDASHTDITLYYEVLDNWLNLDLGITVRAFDGYAQVTSTPEGAVNPLIERVDLDQSIPMLYSRARIDLPFSGFYAGGALNYIGSGDNNIRDVEAYLGYEFDLPALDLGFRLGLKEMSLETQDNDELNADIKIDGVYAAFTLHL